MSQLETIINRLNRLTGFNVPTSSTVIISQSAVPVGSGSVNSIIDLVNTLTGYDIAPTDVQYVSGANVAGPIIIYTPFAAGGTISTQGIVPGAIIRSEHVLRIINALNGVNVNDIIISGSFTTSGSNTLDGSLALPFLEDGKYLYTSGGQVVGIEGGIESASYAATASFAPNYLPLADTASMLAPYVLTSSTASMTVLSSSFATTASYVLGTGTASWAINIVSASGLDTQIQFNQNGLLTGSNKLIYDHGASVFRVESGNTYPIQASSSVGSVGLGGGVIGNDVGIYAGNGDQVIGAFQSNGDQLYVYSNQNYIFNENTAVHSFTGSLLSTQGFTGSLLGTASWAQSASQAISSSFSTTASYALNAGVTIFPFSGSAIITGSLLVSGSGITVTGSLNARSATITNTLSAGETNIGATTINGTLNQGNVGVNIINGVGSHAEGDQTQANGNYSHAEGYRNQSNGNYSHAEGSDSISTGQYSHAEGYNNQSVGTYSHAEGMGSRALEMGSHAEGFGNDAFGYYSHAEGYQSSTSGTGSHAEGFQTQANGNYSHAEGIGTRATKEGQLAIGTYNTDNNTTSLFVIGNGANGSNRSDLALFNPQSIVLSQSIYLPDLVTSPNVTNVVMFGAGGQLFITASSAIGGGGSGAGFPFSGSAVITGSLLVSGSGLIVTGSLNAANITGSLLGTASFALSASRATTASFALAATVFPFTGSAIISGSLTVTGSTNLNGGVGTTVFTSNADILTITGSLLVTGSASITGSLNATNITSSLFGTASWATNFVSASNYVLNSATSSFVQNNQTSSFVLNSQTSSMLSPYLLNSQTSSFLTTGSTNTTQTISGSLIINQNLTVLGSSSIQYVTSSQLNVGTNIITVNTATPAVRFGGLAVFDSGSTGTGRTGSLLWDSQNDIWVYSNPSGAAYDGALLLAGPRNTTGLGSEVGINTWYAALGNGSHHMTSSAIFNSGSLIRLETNTQVTGSLNVSAGVTGSLQGNASSATIASTVQGGLRDYIPLWASNTSLTSSYLNQFDSPPNKGIQTLYGGATIGLYLDLANKYYRLGSATGGPYANLILDENAGYLRANYNGADNGLDLTFNTSTYSFGNLAGNQKITVDATSEIINVADQAPAGIKVESATARTVTIGDVWGNAGSNTKVVVDANNNVVQVTGSFSVQNGAEFLSSITMVLGNYGDDTEAAANGVPVNGLYRNGNVVSIRVT